MIKFYTVMRLKIFYYYALSVSYPILNMVQGVNEPKVPSSNSLVVSVLDLKDKGLSFQSRYHWYFSALLWPGFSIS